jgi:hypothetical protein
MSDKPADIVPLLDYPFRYTPEIVIRMLMSQIDRVEDISVVVRYKDTTSLTMLKTTGFSTGEYFSISELFREYGANSMNAYSPLPEDPK